MAARAAQEAEVKNALPLYSIVHFATHAERRVVKSKCSLLGTVNKDQAGENARAYGRDRGCTLSRHCGIRIMPANRSCEKGYSKPQRAPFPL